MVHIGSVLRGVVSNSVAEIVLNLEKCKNLVNLLCNADSYIITKHL